MIGVESHEHVRAVATDNELQAGARRGSRNRHGECDDQDHRLGTDHIG